MSGEGNIILYPKDLGKKLSRSFFTKKRKCMALKFMLIKQQYLLKSIKELEKKNNEIKEEISGLNDQYNIFNELDFNFSKMVET